MTLLDNDPHAADAWSDNLPVPSRYTFGLAGERFFRAIKEDGQIIGSYCQRCDHTYVPATLFCERCLDKLEEWVNLGTKGEVYSFTFLFENYDGTPRAIPEIIAFVRFADGGLIHKLNHVAPEEVEIGMVVEAVFKAPGERVGSILDIEYFRPVE